MSREAKYWPDGSLRHLWVMSFRSGTECCHWCGRTRGKATSGKPCPGAAATDFIPGSGPSNPPPRAAPTADDPLDVRAIRAETGLGRRAFSVRYRIPESALKDWELGRERPDRTTAAYLQVIALSPVAVDSALDEFARRSKSHPGYMRAAQAGAEK